MIFDVLDSGAGGATPSSMQKGHWPFSSNVLARRSILHVEQGTNSANALYLTLNYERRTPFNYPY